jgi:hypothetical protein
VARFLDAKVILRYLTRDDEHLPPPISSSSRRSTLWDAATASVGSASGNFCFP